MTFRNTVTIVASPRSRVGKTLLARLLVDYHRQEGHAFQAFDLNGGDDTLAQFLPGEVIQAGVGDVQGQMALFDSLVSPDDVAKIVDVGHEAFDSFFTLAHQIGFMDEARRRSIAPVILFMISADRASTEAYRTLRLRFPRLTLSPVPVRRCCVFRRWRRACANLSRSHHFHFPTASSPTRKTFRSMSISNCNAGSAKCISSSASSICAFCWRICRRRCDCNKIAENSR